MKDLSIFIVHYNTPRLLRQTLKGLYRFAPNCSHEIIVVDNNPKSRVADQVKSEFPGVKIVVNEKNLGFGRGMNSAAAVADGRHFLIFNPDIAILEGSLDKLVNFLDEHPRVGAVGPKLLNPDRSLQTSCYRFAKPLTILARRLPLAEKIPSLKKELDRYLMNDFDHSSTKEIDYLLGASLLVRREAWEKTGGFDPEYFMYFEDQDLCRHLWQLGWKVMYYPESEIVHYHRRETAEGNLLEQLFNPLTRIQIKSARYYFKKWQ
ncbi:MAG: hypothetical protein UX09_C0047G0003 [Candidatus Uhrbacteria bacterium GW2011_GWE2_45_35]|uniref:Glycosyl transferase family 2 n=2 Tax=Candidatus Uhriibacteriota TaxID=1752732 RepID=A0A0G1JDJ0_9BACT|nr:MAG: hypothetical protein UW63_C0059G0003 [Candidatus Uhrbacteria bacterium GW2011_GWF2_44_350]KKU06604.1 MAG: hypothetical protein UX09_C0047G0003 [Candidatus Uhrbacteria bacterium GW2011_GWE2_45_35]HBR80032.1 glycosyltransferase family 2 protein [Candidatus Uhrbacteria bacterium]HCU31751.1 glycosyltransferase family 2 protein [Candidatus Uhrbacteria bacterium]